MTGDDLVRRVRLHIYQCFADTGRAPTPADLSARFDRSPDEIGDLLRHLESDRDAIVLVPGTPYIWMAEPFSAVPTSFPVRSGDRAWFGNCIWDALSILAMLGRDGRVETRSPVDAGPLCFEVRDGTLLPIDAVIHFAVPARDWWKDIGFT